MLYVCWEDYEWLKVILYGWYWYVFGWIVLNIGNKSKWDCWVYGNIVIVIRL